MNEEANRNRQIATSQADEGTEIDLLELFYCLLEKARFILLAGLAGALLMGFYSFYIAKPSYEATSKLYVLNSSDSAINLSDLQIGSQLANDYKEVFKTWEVHEMVCQNLNLSYSYTQLDNMISVSNPSNTRILYITARAGSPREAAQLANEYATVAQKYISETMQTDQPSVFSEALEPVSPVSPKKGRNVVLGFLLGAIALAGVFTVQFIMDDRIKTSEDITKYANMPTLAIVPISGASAAQMRAKAGKSQTKGRGVRR